MAVTIDSELLTFYDKISPVIGTLPSFLSSLSGKLDEVNTSSNTCVSEFMSCYTGEGANKAASSFATIKAAVDGIKASFAEGPEAAVSMASELVKKIKELKDKKEDIDALDNEMSKLLPRKSVDGTDEQKQAARNHNKKIADLEVKIEEEEEKFKTMQEECRSKLSALKGLNPTLDVAVQAIEVDASSGVSIGEVNSQLQNLQEGTINVVDYVGKKGVTVRTFIYVPPGASTTTGLAVDLSMGGDGAKNAEGSRGEKNQGRGGLGAGVGQQLRERSEKGQTNIYSGIVVVLEAYNDHSYSDPNYLDTCKEISDNIVATYKADPNKISINGYSYGVYGTTHMLERFPNYFSQAVLVAGGDGAVGQESSSKEEGFKKISTTKIYFIASDNEPNGTYPGACNFVNQVNKNGGTAILETRHGGHEINTFYKMTVNGKQYDNYVEFCLAQVKGQSN